MQTEAGEPRFAMDAPAVLLPNGKVLCVGAPGMPCDSVTNNPPTPCSYFAFDPTTDTFSDVDPPPNDGSAAIEAHRMLLLPTGQVLLSNLTSTMSIFTPDDALPVEGAAPTVSDPSSLSRLLRGSTEQLSGTQFNGLSQACSFGDDASMATNYPIVRITNMGSGRVDYARTFGFSTRAVATGVNPVSTWVTIPIDTQAGSATLEVVANGIPSLPIPTCISWTLLGNIPTSEISLLAIMITGTSRCFVPMTMVRRGTTTTRATIKGVGAGGPTRSARGP